MVRRLRITTGFPAPVYHAGHCRAPAPCTSASTCLRRRGLCFELLPSNHCKSETPPPAASNHHTVDSTHAAAPNRLGAILFGAAVVNPVCPAQTAGRFADRRPPGGSALTSAGLPKRVSSTRGFKSTMPPPASRPMFRIAPASSPTWPPAESRLHLLLSRASSCLLAAASAIYPATALCRPPVSATGSSRA